MTTRAKLARVVAVAFCAAVGLVACEGQETCGPSRGVVAKVIDGDTVELASGERVRYLMIDTPETTSETECFGPEAKQYNIDRVLGKTIELRYDQQCTDRYDRLLAFVEVDGENLNRTMVAEGFACVLHISPNGDDVVSDYNAVENSARAVSAGLWGACNENPC